MFITILIIITLFIFFAPKLLQLYMEQSKEDIQSEWNLIIKRGREIAQKNEERIKEFSPGEQVYARRSDYHLLEPATIIRFDGVYVFLPYFFVRFKDGHEQSINYCSLRKKGKINN